MSDLVVGLLPAAIGFALSPLPLIALILVLFSRRARSNGPIFLLTLAVPVFFIPLAGGLIGQAAADPGDTASGGWFRLVFGVLLLVLAVMNLRKYNDTDAPEVFDKIDGMGVGAVLVLGLTATVLNPKNLALLLAAGEAMQTAELDGAALVTASAAFALLALLPFLAIVGYQLLGGESAARRLTSLKEVLLRNNHKVMFWVTGVLGTVFLAQAIPFG